MSKPVVIIEFDMDGNVATSFCGDVDVFWVDPRTPQDMVYKSSNQVDERVIKSALGEYIIGYMGDGSDAEKRIAKVFGDQKKP